MPELPEVEITRRGIEPLILGKTVERLAVREPRLRWPVSRRLAVELPGSTVESVKRRGKYLLLGTAKGTVIIHLGMSGSLRASDSLPPPGPHDHLEIRFHGGPTVRLTDPRRFGSVLWTRGNPQRHRLLKNLGPEPLEAGFSGAHLFAQSRNRRVNVKSFLMNGAIVAGLGNIYVNESLFLAGIHPCRSAGRVSLRRYQSIADSVRIVLRESIGQGGTTLRDFSNGAGLPGYFKQYLRVYGRGGEPCLQCGSVVRLARTGQRSTFYCPRCQH